MVVSIVLARAQLTLFSSTVISDRCWLPIEYFWFAVKLIINHTTKKALNRWENALSVLCPSFLLPRIKLLEGGKTHTKAGEGGKYDQTHQTPSTRACHRAAG